MKNTMTSTEPLTIEMRRGDQFVNIVIEDDSNLRDPSYNLSLMSALNSGMAAHGAIWPPMTEDQLREYALDYARRLVSGQQMSPDQAMVHYGVSYEEGVRIAELATTATVVIPA